eukprot:sb/3466598/
MGDDDQLTKVSETIDSQLGKLNLEEDLSRADISRIIKLDKFKVGESFATFCDKFIIQVAIAGLRTPNLHLLFLQALDNETFGNLKIEAEKLSDREKADPKLFCERFKSIVYGDSDSKIFLQQEVYDCKQKNAETIAEYVARLRGKADIAYDNRKDAEIACFFSFRKNLADKTLLRKLKEAAPLNFDDAVKRAKLLETVALEEAANTVPILKQETVTFEHSPERRRRYSREESPYPERRRRDSRDQSFRSRRNNSDSRERESRYRSVYRSDRPSFRHRSSSRDHSSSRGYSRNRSRDSSRERSRGYRPRNWSSNVICWNCDRRGHYQSQCPNLN